MNDILNDKELAPETKEVHGVPLKMGIVSLLMTPASIYFFYDRVNLFGIAFFIGAPILAIIGLGLIKQYKNENPTFSVTQLKKLKTAKIICIVSLCLPLIIILLGIFVFAMVSELH